MLASGLQNIGVAARTQALVVLTHFLDGLSPMYLSQRQMRNDESIYQVIKVRSQLGAHGFHKLCPRLLDSAARLVVFLAATDERPAHGAVELGSRAVLHGHYRAGDECLVPGRRQDHARVGALHSALQACSRPPQPCCHRHQLPLSCSPRLKNMLHGAVPTLGPFAHRGLCCLHRQTFKLTLMLNRMKVPLEKRVSVWQVPRTLQALVVESLMLLVTQIPYLNGEITLHVG